MNPQKIKIVFRENENMPWKTENQIIIDNVRRIQWLNDDGIYSIWFEYDGIPQIQVDTSKKDIRLEFPYKDNSMIDILVVNPLP